MLETCPVQILGTGHALPETEVSSLEMDTRLGLEPGWIERACGVSHRRVCTTESQIDLAVSAAWAAIKDAGVDLKEIDLVLSGSAVPYQTLPTTAPRVMGALGIADGAAQAFDINATCLGFLVALEVAAARIALGQCRMALIFSSEIASRALPWEEAPDVAGLFGDGAGAAILTEAAPGEGAIREWAMQTYPSGYDTSALAAGGTRIDYHANPECFHEHAFFRMDGPALFKLTHRHFPAFVERLLAKVGWAAEDIDLVVPHQASPLALDHMTVATGLSSARVIHIAQRLGNQISVGNFVISGGFVW